MKSKICKYFFPLVLSIITYFTNDLHSQCPQFQADFIDSKCNNNGTPLDPSDDTFTAQVSIDNGLNPNGTWSSSDGRYSNQPYPPTIFTFGPYPISGGNITVTIKDDQFNCPPDNVVLFAPATCSNPPFVCPDFDLCYELIDEGICSATYLVNIGGNLNAYSNINNLNFSFSASGGTIDGVTFLDDLGYFFQKGVQISGSTVFGGSGMSGSDVTNNFFVVTVSTEPPKCVNLSNSGIGMLFGNEICYVQSSNLCPSAQQYCATGNTISGNINAPGQIYDCPDTENHGIEGASISVISASGNTCTTTTDNSGGYSCTTCSDGPFTVCADADCPEPCGLTDYDIALLQQYILYGQLNTKDLRFIGDVNGDGRVTAGDLVAIRKEILKVDTTSVANWCRFVPVSDYAALPNPVGGSSDPTAYTSIDGCVIANSNSPTNFLRYMVGDIDGSCTDCIHGDSIGGVKIVADDTEHGSLKINLPNQFKLHTFTMLLDIPKGTTIQSVNSPLQGLEYSVRNDKLHLIWTDNSVHLSGYIASNGSQIVNILFNGITTPTIIGNENFMVDQLGKIYRMEANEVLKSRSKESRVININNLTTLEIPNHSTALNIMITDLMGRVFLNEKVQILDFIEISTVVQTGIYLLTVYDGQFTKTQKVFIQNY
jgi:hypothetical protein